MKYLYLIVVGMCSVFCTVCSCTTGIGGELAGQILGNKSTPPVFLSCQAVSETEINFRFSQPVKVVSLNFDPAITLDEVEGGDIVRVTFSNGPGVGQRLTADLLAQDKNGNTINVLVPLLTRNNRIPPLLINEICTELANPRCEFIEMKTLSAGNLGALRLFIASNYKAPLVYEFPSVEADAGEYITLHLRTTEDVSRDELGKNLTESGGTDSSPTGRDLWIPGSHELLRKTDVIYLLDQDDRVVDSVLFSEKADPQWDKDYFAAAAELLFNADAWKSPDGKICSPANAVSSIGTSNTRTICRNETLTVSPGDLARQPSDWYIAVTRGATPGKPNNPNQFVLTR